MLAVGRLERLDHFFATLGRTLGVTFPYEGQVHNANEASEPDLLKLTPTVEALVTNMTYYDNILYRAAQEYWG